MLQKIKHLVQRFGACCKALPGNCREFGVSVALHQFWDVLIPVGKSKAYIQALSKRAIQELAPLAQKHARGEGTVYRPKIKLDKTPVWVCWWQGEAAMPPIVKACVRRMRHMLPETARLHILTWENMHQYIDLPEHVLEKYRKGVISAAHLSDVLRFGLLASYGGGWLDATVYLAEAFPQKLLTLPFYTQRFATWESCPQEACRGKWCGFFLGGRPDNGVFSYMYEALCQWWRCHDRVMDYVFFDYILWAGYSTVPAIKERIDAVPPENENIWLLAKHLNEAYSPQEFKKLMESNGFFKLSYKGQLDMETPDGHKTVYAQLLEENNTV